MRIDFRSIPITYNEDGLVVGPIFILFLTAVALIGRSVMNNPLSIIYGTIAICVILYYPGYVIINHYSKDSELRSHIHIYSVVLSVLLFTFVLFASSLFADNFGIKIISEDILPLLSFIYILFIIVIFRIPLRFNQHKGLGKTDVFFLILSLALFASTISSMRILNNFGNNGPILGVLLILSILPLIIWVKNPREYVFPPVIFLTGLSLLIHRTQWKYYFFGGHEHAVQIWYSGIWTPQQTSLLQNGLLYPGIAILGDINPIQVYSSYHLILIAIMPVAIYYICRSFYSSNISFFSSFLFMYVYPFYVVFPESGRNAPPLLFLLMFMLLIAEDRFNPKLNVSLSIAFLLGIAITHYGTYYFVLFSTVTAVGVLQVANILLGDRKTSWFEQHGTNLSVTLAVVGISWYLFTWVDKFLLLPQRGLAVFNKLLSGRLFAGGAANQLQREYSSLAVQTSKILYLTIAVLAIIGMVYILFGRLTTRGTFLPDSYLVMMIAILSWFAVGSMFVSYWSGARVMMIGLAVAPFLPAIGLMKIVRRIDNIHISKYSLGILIMMLLLFSSGFMSALGYPGYAPSNVPVNESEFHHPEQKIASKPYLEYDLTTHAWLVNHHNKVNQVYGDGMAKYQAKDWYVSHITLRAKGNQYGESWTPGATWRPHSELYRLRDRPSSAGYVLLLGHNIQYKVIWNGYYTPTPRVYYYNDPEWLDIRHNIYTTDKTEIHFRK